MSGHQISYLQHFQKIEDTKYLNKLSENDPLDIYLIFLLKQSIDDSKKSQPELLRENDLCMVSFEIDESEFSKLLDCCPDGNFEFDLQLSMVLKENNEFVIKSIAIPCEINIFKSLISSGNFIYFKKYFFQDDL